MDWSDLLGWIVITYDTVLLLLLCETGTNFMQIIFFPKFLERIWWVVSQLMYSWSYIIRLFWASTSWTFATVSRFWTIKAVHYLNRLCIAHVLLWIFEPFGAECYRFVMFSVMLKMLNVNYCQWPVMVTQFQSLQSPVGHTGHLCYQKVKLLKASVQVRALLYLQT